MVGQVAIEYLFPPPVIVDIIRLDGKIGCFQSGFLYSQGFEFFSEGIDPGVHREDALFVLHLPLFDIEAQYYQVGFGRDRSLPGDTEDSFFHRYHG